MVPLSEPFHGLLCRVVQTRTQELKTSAPKIAEKLGPAYRSFNYWLNGQRKFPAELLPSLCAALGDFQLLDELEHQVGRVAYEVPKLRELPNADDIRAVQRLVKEVGEALCELSNTLKDGKVEKHEMDQTIPKLDRVIHECASLKHWLRVRHKEDFPNKARDGGL